MATQGKKLRFNVGAGGEIFETTTTTISKASADSPLTAMLDNARFDQLGEHFIDRDPACFRVFLNLLRTDELHIPPGISDTLLYEEADRYKLLDKLRYAKHDKLDGDNLKLTTSIPGAGGTLLNNSAALIRASAKGNCAVANGNVFHVYDWMFRRLPTMNLDYMKIVCMDWYDSENIIISGQKNSSNSKAGGGAIGLFNPQTGKLKHKFEPRHDRPSIMTPGNLAIGSDKKIFFCCKDYSYKKKDSIGVWDITTSHATDFLEASSVGNASKLQWLPNINCLMAVFHNYEGNNISIFDPRAKIPPPYKMNHPTTPVVDAVGIEKMNCVCVCVIDKSGRFGFVDIRMPVVDKSSIEEHGKRFPLPGEGMEPKLGGRPKLGWHEGKLFRFVDDVVSVYCESGSEWRLASQYRPQHGRGGLIHDFSIGGDRLFSLQAHPPNDYKNNVWETPRPLRPLPRPRW